MLKQPQRHSYRRDEFSPANNFNFSKKKNRTNTLITLKKFPTSQIINSELCVFVFYFKYCDNYTLSMWYSVVIMYVVNTTTDVCDVYVVRM